MPEQFGKYLLLDPINQGGMAEIYLAKAFGFGGTDQIIAVKRIRKEVSEDPAFVEMFVNEAKLSVLLNHANIAQIFELGKHGKNYYIAMEYIPGRDLRAILDRANNDGIQLPVHLVLHIVAHVLDGLDFAHRKTDLTGKPLDIVHRDISPHNVLISYTGEVKLIDFGIAKAASDPTHSQSGVLKGKYGYMSPEQVLGRNVDARTDIFATGVLSYELLTQQRLFDGASDFSILEKVRYAEVYPPSTLSPSVPPEVEAVVLRALSSQPDERYPTASDMHDAVVEVMLGAYGTPTARELANLMKSLFGAEIKDDLRLLEKAREYAQPIDQGEDPGSTAAERGSPGDGDTEREYELPSGALASELDETLEQFVPRETTRPDIVASRIPGAVVNPIAMPGQEESGSGRQLGRVALVDAASRARLDAQVANVKPTEVRPAYKKPPLSRDHLIVGGALLVALALVLVSWLATRSGEVDTTGEVMILSVPPGASVILDGVVVGRTPYRAHTLQIGKHTMVLELAYYRTEERVIAVVPNEMLPVQLVLKPVEATTSLGGK